MLFSVFPKVVRAGEVSRITVRTKYAPFPRSVAATVTPMEGKGRASSTRRIEPGPDALSLEIAFESEQEYAIRLTDPGAGGTLLAELHVYAAGDDLHALTPWKGDFHMHSTRSDGREEPAYVAGACRRIGMDFMALTDHRLYEPSLEAIEAFRGRPIDLAIFPGEEVHPPGVSTHILHLGGSESINALFESREYKTAVAARVAELTDLPREVRDMYAACTWCFDRIRSCGGVGILAHPYWVFQDLYNVPEPLLSIFLERIPFDALELIGGYHVEEVESNALQVARWQEECAKGKRIPVVGVSDAHGCETGKLFGWYYTIVFAPSLRLPDLASAMRDMRSVAVEAMPGAPSKVYGPFRLVKLGHFLIREVFPLHDELSFDEGKTMLALLAGEPGAEDRLRELRGRTERLYDLLWGRVSQRRADTGKP
jgi:predicted metal-dependent phosphoesterase TrpH